MNNHMGKMTRSRLLRLLRTESGVLAIILFLALALRLWGIGFGLPYAYHVDEPTYVSAALNLGAGIIGKQPNPTGFSNILFVEYALYFILGKLAGVFGSVADFEAAYRADPSIFLLLSRLTSALFGTANVLVVYWLGKTIRNRLTGILAAVILSVVFLHVRDSHYGVPDITATLFVSLAVLGSALGIQKMQWRYAGLGAIAGGLAIATKWNVGWVVLPVFLSIYWLSFTPQVDNRKPFNHRNSIIAVIVCLAVGLLIGGFQLFIKPSTYFVYALSEARSGSAGGFGFWQIDTVPGWIFYIKTLVYGLGTVIVVLALLGGIRQLLLALRSHNRLSYLLLAFPVTYFIAMGATRHYFARYALPLVPFAAVFAADIISWLTDWVAKQNTRLAPLVTALVLLVAIAQPFVASIRHDILLTRQDTRTLAKEWIEANIPAGAKIAVDWPTHGPPLSTPEKSAPNSKRTYDVTLVGGTGLSDHPVAWYRQQGFEYLIASSFIYRIPLVYKKRNAERQAFYASLNNEFELVQEFRPYEGDTEPPFIFDEIYGPLISLWKRDRPGPTLKIYQIQP